VTAQTTDAGPRNLLQSLLTLARTAFACRARCLRIAVDRLEIDSLRNEWPFWAEICHVAEISKGTAQRTVLSLSIDLPEIALLNS